jgi:hypothetical protein
MRKRLLLGLGFLVCAGLALSVAQFDPWGRRGPVWDHYRQVRLGMTEEEVKAILGPPDSVDSFGLGFDYLGWFKGQQTITVDFDVDGRAAEKRFHAGPGSWWVREPPHPLSKEVKDRFGDLWP